MNVEFILYVSDQEKSREFYSVVLDKNPSLHVPGMTEFQLGPSVKLGLMPEAGIAKIITPHTPHPETGSGIPRCELYLKVNDASEYMQRALQNGAQLVSDVSPRDWGHTVGYIVDPDGHIIAFAQNN